MLGSNQPKIGYEPISFTKNLRVVAEDIGIEPNTRRYISLSRRTLSPSRFIFRSAHNRTRTYNLRRIRSALSPLSYMSGCGQGRTRTFNHSINSRGLYHWATCPFCCGSRWNRTTKPMFYRHEQDPADTPFLYTLQGSNLWPVVCKTTATTNWAKSACFSSTEQI